VTDLFSTSNFFLVHFFAFLFSLRCHLEVFLCKKKMTTTDVLNRLCMVNEEIDGRIVPMESYQVDFFEGPFKEIIREMSGE